MTEVETNVATKDAVVESGTRVRRIRLQPNHCMFSSGFRLPLDSEVSIEHLIIRFVSVRGGRKYRSFSTVTAIFGASKDPEFVLNDYGSSWEISMKLTLWAEEGDGERISKELEFSLSDIKCSTSIYFDEIGFDVEQIDLDFITIKGLGIQSPRDYSVKDKYSDVAFIVADQKFHLNKAFIASRSSFFEKLLYGDFKEKNQDEIELKNVSAAAFTELLDSLSHPLHQFDKESLVPVLQLAHQFDVPLVLNKIEVMLVSTTEPRIFNKTERLLMADKYGLNVLLMGELSCWEKGDAERYMTDELWNELSSSLLLKLFKKFA